MTRDDALLILNDHVGRSVEITVTLHRGDLPRWVTTACGTLQHWRTADPFAAAWSGHPRDDITGLYEVGNDAGFDVTGLHDAKPITTAEARAPIGLSFTLTESDDDATELTVMWGREQ